MHTRIQTEIGVTPREVMSLLCPLSCSLNSLYLRDLIKSLSLLLFSHLSLVQFFAILWTVAHQVPLSIGFSRQEYWSGLPCPPPGDLPNPGVKPKSPALRSSLHLYNFYITSFISHCFTSEGHLFIWEQKRLSLLLLLSRFSRVRLCATP